MRPLELAGRYTDILYGAGSIEASSDLFAEGLSFQGPFCEFDAVAAYLQPLRADPPDGFGYELADTYENDTSASLVYQFRRGVFLRRCPSDSGWRTEKSPQSCSSSTPQRSRERIPGGVNAMSIPASGRSAPVADSRP